MTTSATISICPHHEYQVPLFFTFAFPGAEWWCPYCGAKYGYLNSVPRVPATDELNLRLAVYVAAYSGYLRGMGFLVCSKTKVRGKWVAPNDTSPWFQTNMRRLRKSWKANIRAEE